MRKRSQYFGFVLFLSLPLSYSQHIAGVKFTTESVSSGIASQRITYFQGDRKREEYRNSFGRRMPDGETRRFVGPHMASITRCDLGRMYELNFDSAEFVVAHYPPKPYTQEEMKKRGIRTQKWSAADPITLRIEVTTMDTGGRKEMFGHVARHVVTTMTQTPLAGSSALPQENTTDGWYIDLNVQLPCAPLAGKKVRGYSFGFVRGNQERTEFVSHGERETGFLLDSVSTSKSSYKSADGTVKQACSRTEQRVTDLQEGPLDPALFDVPYRFKKVDRLERDPPSAMSSAARQSQ